MVHTILAASIFFHWRAFYYEGFQIGSLWFAYLTLQNAAYYIVAFLLIPIGIGTVKLQKLGMETFLESSVIMDCFRCKYND
jgi:hypothetical protein